MADLLIKNMEMPQEGHIEAFYGQNRCPANMGLFQLGDDKEETIKTITSRWNTRATPWHTGTPTEEGWYLFKWYDDKEYWFTVECINLEWIKKKDEWDSFDNCKWQKIEEK